MLLRSIYFGCRVGRKNATLDLYRYLENIYTKLQYITKSLLTSPGSRDNIAIQVTKNNIGNSILHQGQRQAFESTFFGAALI
jgi:hypothetical protein